MLPRSAEVLIRCEGVPDGALRQHFLFPPRPGADALPRLSLTLDTERARTGDGTLTRVVAGVLSGLGLSPAQARRLVDGAQLTTHYVTGHSRAERLRLHLVAAAHGITVNTTDYLAESGGVERSPVWLLMRGEAMQPLPEDKTGFDPAGERQAHPEQLLLYRTMDGQIDLGFHSPWPIEATTG